MQRIRAGRPAKSVLMVGLRGVGKTVLLDKMRQQAEGHGIQTLRLEAPEDRSLPSILAPQLRTALLRLSRNERAKDLAERALRGLKGFVRSLRVSYGDITLDFEGEEEPGLADNGDLELDLSDLLEAAGTAAKKGDTALALFIDELQYVKEEELAALITSLHRAAQRQLPIVLTGAGLPQLRGRMGRAKSYAERLFDFPELSPLDKAASDQAIRLPVEAEGASIEQPALDLIFQQTKGYPYFLQEWGKHAWDVADSPPITQQDVELATDTALAALDASFFRVRFDRLTPAEKSYLRAMAELGPGPHRSGDIATLLNKPVSALAPRRAGLIGKGMIWSPEHGDTAFTVPLFDAFMKRIMPGNGWKE